MGAGPGLRGVVGGGWWWDLEGVAESSVVWPLPSSSSAECCLMKGGLGAWEGVCERPLALSGCSCAHSGMFASPSSSAASKRSAQLLDMPPDIPPALARVRVETSDPTTEESNWMSPVVGGERVWRWRCGCGGGDGDVME